MFCARFNTIYLQPAVYKTNALTCSGSRYVDCLRVLIRQTVATLLIPNWCTCRLLAGTEGYTGIIRVGMSAHGVTLAIDYQGPLHLQLLTYMYDCHTLSDVQIYRLFNNKLVRMKLN